MEKFAIASYNNTNELLNQTLEVLTVCWHVYIKMDFA